MSAQNRTKAIVLTVAGLLIVVLLAVLIGITVGDRPEDTTTAPSGETTKATTQPTELPAEDTTVPATEPTQQEQPVTPPTQLPPSVTVPPVKDPASGKETIQFPCQVEGYQLVLEKLAPYSGMFVEDGSNVEVQDVAMLLVRNNGEFPVEYTSIQVSWGSELLTFDISALPVGAGVVVQEKNGKSIPAGEPEACQALVVQRAQLEMSQQMVSVTDNGDNTLSVSNLTDSMIPTVRVFYKYYMEDEGLYVGGIAFTVRLTRLAAGGTVVIQPSHFTSQTGRVVMVLTYDTEN